MGASSPRETIAPPAVKEVDRVSRPCFITRAGADRRPSPLRETNLQAVPPGLRHSLRRENEEVARFNLGQDFRINFDHVRLRVESNQTSASGTGEIGQESFGFVRDGSFNAYAGEGRLA